MKTPEERPFSQHYNILDFNITLLLFQDFLYQTQYNPFKENIFLLNLEFFLKMSQLSVSGNITITVQSQCIPF